jgi:hypothetical protein
MAHYYIYKSCIFCYTNVIRRLSRPQGGLTYLLRPLPRMQLSHDRQLRSPRAAQHDDMASKNRAGRQAKGGEWGGEPLLEATKRNTMCWKYTGTRRQDEKGRDWRKDAREWA